MVERFKFLPEDFEDYLDELHERFETTIAWNTLQGKSEYGTYNSEKGYQKVAVLKAGTMARELELNEKRTKFYTMCLGAAFPAYGKEGKKCLKEYAEAHNFPYDEKELMATVIEESIDKSGDIVIEGLREILVELFDEKSDSKIPEIELAKLYHEQMEILKIYDMSSRTEFWEGEKSLDEQIAKRIKDLGITGCKKQLNEYKEKLHVKLKSMTAKERTHYFAELDKYKDSFGEENTLSMFILVAENFTLSN